MPWLLALVTGISLVPVLAAPSAIESLNHFYEQVTTFSARFEQVVLDESLNTIEESAGVMSIKRPGRFRWEYEPPNEQLIVSDGDKVWLFDLELEQITVRPLSKTLGETPASLLAGGSDLETSFDLQDLGRSGPLAWVAISPKRAEEGGFEDMRIGFEGGRLRVMEMVDGLGQTTRITLTDASENPELEDSSFEFVPPAGVDVIDETSP